MSALRNGLDDALTSLPDEWHSARLRVRLRPIEDHLREYAAKALADLQTFTGARREGEHYVIDIRPGEPHPSQILHGLRPLDGVRLGEGVDLVDVTASAATMARWAPPA